MIHSHNLTRSIIRLESYLNWWKAIIFYKIANFERLWRFLIANLKNFHSFIDFKAINKNWTLSLYLYSYCVLLFSIQVAAHRLTNFRWYWCVKFSFKTGQLRSVRFSHSIEANVKTSQQNYPINFFLFLYTIFNSLSQTPKRKINKSYIHSVLIYWI